MQDFLVITYIKYPRGSATFLLCSIRVYAHGQKQFTITYIEMSLPCDLTT